MKVKMLKPQSVILTTLMLITIISIVSSLQITTGSNLSIPYSYLDNVNNNDKLNKQTFINDIKNEEISSFKYFKNFISNLINPNNFLENINLWDDNFSYKPNHKLKTSFNSNTQKILNFHNEQFKVVEVSNCNMDNCEIGNGRCVSENKCKCNFSLLNVPGVSKKACDYKLSFQLDAMILEMLFPIGLGHLYCKRYLIGFIKFSFLFIIPFIIYAISKANLFCNENISNVKTIGNKKFENFFSLDSIVKRFISFYFFIIFFIWYIFDIVIFAANKHKDGSGFDLIPF
jgi:hypothetical protein